MPEYKLIYFNGKGFAEISRLLFVYAGVDYEDVRFKDKDDFVNNWKPKLPNGQAPCLEVDGKKFPQSNAIARYLAREFKLYGKDNIEAMQIDAVMETATDIRSALSALFSETDEAKKAEIKKVALTEKFPKTLGMLENLAQGDGVFVGDSISVADIGFYRVMEIVKGHKADILDDYPKLKAIEEKVRTETKIAAWLAVRPVTQF